MSLGHTVSGLSTAELCGARGGEWRVGLGERHATREKILVH